MTAISGSSQLSVPPPDVITEGITALLINVTYKLHKGFKHLNVLLRLFLKGTFTLTVCINYLAKALSVLGTELGLFITGILEDFGWCVFLVPSGLSLCFRTFWKVTGEVFAVNAASSGPENEKCKVIQKSGSLNKPVLLTDNLSPKSLRTTRLLRLVLAIHCIYCVRLHHQFLRRPPTPLSPCQDSGLHLYLDTRPNK